VCTTTNTEAHMKENELRELVAKKHRIPDVPDVVWEDLDEEHLVLVAMGGGEDELEDLLRAAGRRLKVYRAGREDEAGHASPPGRKEGSKSQTVSIELREAETERGHALSEFLTHLNNEDSTKNAKDARPIATKVTMSWGKGPPLWKITLAVAPWVNAKEVERAYRLIQRQVIGKGSRPLSLRSMTVFRFVEELLSSNEGTRPSWRKLLTLYNERYPKGHKLHFKVKDEDPRNFQHTYERAYAEIICCGFDYSFPRRELTTDHKERAREALEKAEAIVALDKARQKKRRST
jgi:hypothetical protein